MKKEYFVFVVAVLLAFFLLGGCIKLGPEPEKPPDGAANESEPQVGGEEQEPVPAAGWGRNFGGQKDEQGVWITETEDGGYLAVGYSNSYDEYYDVYLLGWTLMAMRYGTKPQATDIVKTHCLQ